MQTPGAPLRSALKGGTAPDAPSPRDFRTSGHVCLPFCQTRGWCTGTSGTRARESQAQKRACFRVSAFCLFYILRVPQFLGNVPHWLGWVAQKARYFLCLGFRPKDELEGPSWNSTR